MGHTGRAEKESNGPRTTRASARRSGHRRKAEWVGNSPPSAYAGGQAETVEDPAPPSDRGRDGAGDGVDGSMTHYHTPHHKDTAFNPLSFIRRHILGTRSGGPKRRRADGTGETEETEPPDPESVDFTGITAADVWEVLANGRRRRAIRLVDSHGGAWTVTELSAEIAREEGGHHTTNDVTPAEEKRVHVALLQSHLPTLERGRAVVADDDGRLHAGDNLDGFASLLHAAEVADWIENTDTIANDRGRAGGKRTEGPHEF